MNKWISKSHGKPRYYILYMPSHPFARSDGGILEHRFVMEQKLGRYLKSNERIHHIDGNGFNNSLDNLELFENPQQHNSYPHKQYQGWFPKGMVPWNKTFTTKTCIICKREFYLPPRNSEARKTCSIKCRRVYGWVKHS